MKSGSIFAGRYEIIEELGKGGMGRVYRVEDTKIREEIAFVFPSYKYGNRFEFIP